MHNYKGGELSREVNLSKVELIEEIMEAFLDTDFYYDDSSPLTEEKIVTHFKNVNNLPEFSLYAGGEDSYVAELYYTTSTGDLEEIDITQFIKDNVSDFAKILITNNQELSDYSEEKESTVEYDKAITLNNSKPQPLV